jgi:thiaminase/transcriptional activator TenA
MKNNRSLQLDPDFININQLSTKRPPEDSLFWMLWNQNIKTAEEALHTDFIQGIKNGTLDPVTYGGFNVSDAYYCFHGAEGYQTAAAKAETPVLKAFLLKKYQGYESYNATFPTIWHIKDADGIVPSEVCKAYSEFESTVAQNQEAIYTLIAMIPCEYLWAWLGEQLSPAADTNLYKPWIDGNNDPSGAYAMGNFIDAYQKVHEIDVDLALQIYSQAMTYEYQNFKTA